MVWFSCEDCGDTIKKPKLQSHMSQCSSSRLTCLDCNATFCRNDVKGHTKCVTEHEKYAQGATKTGGYAAAGFASASATEAASTPATPSSAYLATKPPWTCGVCKVTCTSHDTLLGHAGGAKHIRRARAAERAAKAGTIEQRAPAANGCAASVAAEKTSNDIDDGEAAAEQKRKREPDEAAKPALNGDSHGSLKKKKTKTGGKDTTENGSNKAHGGMPKSGRALGEIKWKKLAAKELQVVERMSLAKLQKRVLLSAGQESSAKAAEYFLARLQGSSQFVIADGFVKLST